MTRGIRITALGALSLVASAALAASARGADDAPQPRVGAPADRRAPLTRDDYRHFRIEAIDLEGRMPTRDEIAAFEAPGFDEEAWIDAQLAGPAYAERMTRIYMDLLRLEPNVSFAPGPAQLFRQELIGPDGKPVFVFYRAGQRRAREASDGEFCLTPEETGIVVRPNAQPTGTPHKVSAKVLDAYTTEVSPWWLYRDYRAARPTLRLGEGWSDPNPDYKLSDALTTEPDGRPTVTVRVCREEAQAAAIGHVYASGRTGARGGGANRAKGAKAIDARLPGGRLKPAPVDRPYAIQHAGEALACDSRLALDTAVDCGCGVGLERCMPNDGPNQGSAFYFPSHTPLGAGLPLDLAKQQPQRWFPYWWSREAVRFLDDLFANDRDFREILTGRQTFVNGPLAQFYRTIQRGSCCGPEATFGMTEEREPLFDPSRVPEDLAPHDLGKWERVDDRGPHAAGVLTLPIFLEKFASARARGAALYGAFLCKSFVADAGTELTPSTEPNLMVRPGCSTCHATLEPLAAYFARVEAGSFVFLPAAEFPLRAGACKKDRNGKLNGPCNALYDAAFADDHGAMLRSAYGSPAHADATPAGAAAEITASPDFAACAVQRVTSSFLGRATTPDDAPLLRALEHELVASGFRMRALVRALVRSPTYRLANNDRLGASSGPPVLAPSPHGNGGVAP